MLLRNVFYPGLDTKKTLTDIRERERGKWVDQYKDRVGQMEDMSDGDFTAQQSPALSAQHCGANILNKIIYLYIIQYHTTKIEIFT